MKFEDIIALAKSGFTPSDIKELMSMEKEEPKDEPKEEPKDEPKEEPKDEPKEEPKDEPDYKAMFEESQKRLEELQADNRSKNIDDPNKATDADTVAELFRSFM